MQPDPFITASCLITGGAAYKNGSAVFEARGLTALDFLDELYRHLKLSYPKFHKMDGLSKLGILAAEILLQDTEHGHKYAEDETGLVLSNANSSLDADLKYARTISTGASPALFVYTLPNIVIGEISIRHRFKGENAFFVFKQFNGNFIASYVNGLLENKLIKRCICGWVDFLEEDYRAFLVLAESSKSGLAIPFAAENLNQLNNATYG